MSRRKLKMETAHRESHAHTTQRQPACLPPLITHWRANVYALAASFRSSHASHLDVSELARKQTASHHAPPVNSAPQKIDIAWNRLHVAPLIRMHTADMPPQRCQASSPYQWLEWKAVRTCTALEGRPLQLTRKRVTTDASCRENAVETDNSPEGSCSVTVLITSHEMRECRKRTESMYSICPSQISLRLS